MEHNNKKEYCINKTFLSLYNSKIILCIIALICLFQEANSQDNTNYAYNNTLCVTFSNLRYANYSQFVETYDSSLVIPENYCYGALTYNITKEAYDNIIDYNLQAFKLYRRFLNMYYLYNVTTDTSQISMNDGCLPYFRYIACYTVFKACEETKTGGFVENDVCHSRCNSFNIRCGAYANYGVCENNSTAKYCAGVNDALYLKVKTWIFIFFIIYSFLIA